MADNSPNEGGRAHERKIEDHQLVHAAPVWLRHQLNNGIKTYRSHQHIGEGSHGFIYPDA